MKIKVQTKTGAFDFESDDDETLLYAGLRQGVELPYECATGTCGTCRARVHEGEAEMIWEEAPGVSYIKREKNEILMCRAKAKGSCTLRVPAQVTESDGGPNGASLPAYCQGELRNYQRLTHDVVQFEVALEGPMSFAAGQFALLEADAVVGNRAYSMVNYATRTDTLVFVVKRKPEGKFSDWLFDNDVTGTTLKVFGPLGRATFDPAEGKNVICIAGGSGIAGMMAIIEHGCQSGHFADHKGYIFFGVRTEKDTFYLDEFSAQVARYPDNLEVTIALSDEEDTSAIAARYPNLRFATGFVHSVASERMVGKYDNMVAYVAGPPPMVDGALRMLVLEAKLPGTDIRYDKFS